MAVNPLHEFERHPDETPAPLGDPDSAVDSPTPDAVIGPADSPIETALQSLIDLNGPALLFESDRLAADLRERCPDADREISVLLRALDLQVPQELLGTHTDEDLQSLLPRLAKQLSDRKRLSNEASTWAVRTWARGLGLAVFATGPLPERLYAEVVPPAALSAAAMPSAARPGNRRSKASSMWIAACVAIVAVIAAGLASFHAPPAASARVVRGEPPIDDRSMREEIAPAKDAAPVIAAIEAPRPVVPEAARSEPRRIALDPVPQARIAARECTSATCGKIVDVRELAANGRGKTYEVTILTDNGTTHLRTQETRWKKGARVRVIANTIAAVSG